MNGFEPAARWIATTATNPSIPADGRASPTGALVPLGCGQPAQMAAVQWLELASGSR